MKTTYIALLRGINVGGKNVIKMEKLKQCFEDLGFSDVKTYIQSGNVIFKTKDTIIQELTEIVENQLLNTFSAQIKTAVFTANELLEIIENAPKDFGSEPEKFRYDVWFLLPPLMANEVATNVRLRDGVDSLHTGKSAVYSSRLTGEMNKSHLSKINQTLIYQNLTIRNWNTTTKLAELARNVN